MLTVLEPSAKLGWVTKGQFSGNFGCTQLSPDNYWPAFVLHFIIHNKVSTGVHYGKQQRCAAPHFNLCDSDHTLHDLDGWLLAG